MSLKVRIAALQGDPQKQHAALKEILGVIASNRVGGGDPTAVTRMLEADFSAAPRPITPRAQEFETTNISADHRYTKFKQEYLKKLRPLPFLIFLFQKVPAIFSYLIAFYLIAFVVLSEL